jgi:hypothetical protein
MARRFTRKLLKRGTNGSKIRCFGRWSWDGTQVDCAGHLKKHESIAFQKRDFDRDFAKWSIGPLVLPLPVVQRCDFHGFDRFI